MAKKKKPKKNMNEKLADKIDKAVKETPEGGNPFKGMTFTDEERLALAEAGCV